MLWKQTKNSFDPLGDIGFTMLVTKEPTPLRHVSVSLYRPPWLALNEMLYSCPDLKTMELFTLYHQVACFLPLVSHCLSTSVSSLGSAQGSEFLDLPWNPWGNCLWIPRTLTFGIIHFNNHIQPRSLKSSIGN